MEPDANLEHYGRALADALDAVLPEWVVRVVAGRWHDWKGSEPVPAEVLAMARAAGEQARVEAGASVRALLALDVDEQRVNPLSYVRAAVSYPTGVLRAAGVPEVVRDEFDERAFPDDVYALSPASFADVDQSLFEPGLEWGAAKAHAHLSRRRR
ncbi:MAG TPA: hypothetical protein VGZ52_09905 [Acidimicrobiales bacterium]|jgi:hypothetical protein|nr:hypothetical protein [Acidimicrobiales bacterium]